VSVQSFGGEEFAVAVGALGHICGGCWWEQMIETSDEKACHALGIHMAKIDARAHVVLHFPSLFPPSLGTQISMFGWWEESLEGMRRL
jgi:hypothetical protein